MFKKRLKQIGAWILAASMILGSAQLPAKAADNNPAATEANLALKATATEDSSGYDSAEAGAGFVISKINDGNLETRWSHKVNTTPWVQLEWETPQTMKSIYVTWQRKNIKAYNLEVSDDGENWREVWSRDEVPTTNMVESILPEAVTAKYLRLNIKEVNEQEAGSTMKWRACSIYEMEVYADTRPDLRTEAEIIMEDLTLTAPVINAETGKIEVPEVPEGAQLQFFADYEQIIGADGTVYQPLEAKTVKGVYKLTASDGSFVKSQQEFTVSVPGKYTDDDSANAKPAVIPELQEWHGTSGNFLASGTSRIIVGSEELTAVAKEFAKDYKDIAGSAIQVVSGTKADAKRGDFYLELTSEDKGLDKEGYTIEIADAVSVQAEQATGAYWSTRTLLQIIKQTNGSIPKGLVRDYPKFEVRAFSFDIGRKPFTLDAVSQFAKNMAWYKMNSLQLHMSDNLIFHEDYPTIEEAVEKSYAGFRLESGVVNEDTNKSATSEDLFYTKEEFRSFIQNCRMMGVDIVPEFDMPAHALPFTRAFPQYMTKKAGGNHAYLIEELNLEAEGVTEWAQSIWNDYFEGSNPIFDEEMTVHIGTDEYHGTSGQEGKELFRQFSDDMIKFVQGKGRKVRMWGSLSNKSGTTPVESEGVQLNIWNTGYANPKAMYDLGYDLINTLEGYNYIVPAAGYYNDYINASNIYNNWKPNVIDSMNASAGDDQILGGCYAIWHDSIDTRANGISQYDSFDRFFKPLPAYSAKLWGEAEDRDYNGLTEVAEKTGTAPNTNMYYEVDYTSDKLADWTFDETLEKDSSINANNLTDSKNAKIVNTDDGKALRLTGGKSYVTTPLDIVGENAILTMKVKKDMGAEGEQILCESKDAFGTYGTYAFKAVQKNTGKVGFSREGYDYSFNYELPENEWVTLTFKSGQNNVSLFVNGELVEGKPEIYFANHPETELSATLSAKGITKISTMMVPIGRIGSTTNSFKGQIESVSVSFDNQIIVEGEAVPQSELTADACSDCDEGSGGGRASAAIDGNINTYWHSNWSNDVTINDEHHWFKVTLANPTEINMLTYVPRQSSRNGRIFNYSLIVEKEDGTTETVVSHGTWADNADKKVAKFKPIVAKSVKIQIHEAAGDGNGTHATIGELNLYKPFTYDKSELEALIAEADQLKEAEYTVMSWQAFARVLNEARQVAANEESTPEECSYAHDTLDAAMKALAAKTVDDRLSDAVKEAEQADENDFAGDSFAAYQEAAQAVKDLPENATEEQKKAAVEALEAAKDNLANIGELRDAIAGTSSSFLAGCSASSQAVYSAKVAAANAVIANAAATKAEVKDALKALSEAKEALVDLTGLRTAIQAVEDKGYVKDEYTADSWKNLEDALNAAKALLEKEDATQKEVSDAIAALYSAEEALAKSSPITSMGMLSIVYNAFNGMDLSGFTKASKDALDNALSEADKLLKASGVLPQQFEEAISDILKAAAGLKVDTSKLEGDLAAAQGSIAELETTVGTLTTTVGKLTEDLGASNTEIGKLQEALNTVKTEAANQLQAVKTELEKQAADAKKKAEEAEAAAKKAQQDLEEAQKRETAQKAELDRLKAQAEELRKAAEEAKKAQEETDAKVAQMQKMIDQEKFKNSKVNVSMKGQPKKIKVSWKKVSGADGYEIAYSTKSSMKGKKKVDVKGGNKTGATIKNLTSKKSYYVCVRAYKNVDGKKIYTKTTAKKRIRVK